MQPFSLLRKLKATVSRAFNILESVIVRKSYCNRIFDTTNKIGPSAVTFRPFSVFVLVFVLFFSVHGGDCGFAIARLKYNGGGDWYANPSSLPNLVEAVRLRTAIPICDSIATINIDDNDLFRHPFLYMTGHGDVRLSEQQRIRLRKYLIGGGFLWADDNYGMDRTFRREMETIFPQNPLTILPADHPIYRSVYTLPGLPKIHEHDGGPAEGYGIVFDNRLVVFYSFNSDIGDGMENLEVHNDGPELHELSLRMGVNIVSWFFSP